MASVSEHVYRAGEGEQLVLLHGFTGTWHHWRPVIADLVPHFEVVAPTLAGHDGGPAFEKTGELTLADAADSLEEHLDELGVGRAHLVGNSMGGALAIELAKRGRALSVVALAPGGGWRDGDDEPERLARFFARTQKMARAAEPWLPRIMARPGTRRIALRDAMCHGHQMPAADAIDLVRRSVRCAIVPKVLEALRARRAGLTDLDSVDAPTLVAWPERDRILPLARHSQRFRDEIPGVEYRVLPRIGHVPMWDHPRLVSETILGFARKHAAEPAPA